MALSGRRAAAAGVAVIVSLLGLINPAYAADSLQQCMNQSIRHNGEMPTCTQVNGSWVPSWPGDAGLSGGGIPSGFIALFVLALLIGIGVTVWKVSTARTLATRSGMDPGLATQMTLLTDDGLDATYLAASLRQPPPTPAVPASDAASTGTTEPPPASVAKRLVELTSLLDQGLISSMEFDARRRAIIDSV